MIDADHSSADYLKYTLSNQLQEIQKKSQGVIFTGSCYSFVIPLLILYQSFCEPEESTADLSGSDGFDGSKSKSTSGKVGWVPHGEEFLGTFRMFGNECTK